MVELIACLRPNAPTNHAEASSKIQQLCQLLKADQTHQFALRQYCLNLFVSRRQSSLYSDIGVLSNDGFFSELKKRISFRILPPALGDAYLTDALDEVFFIKTDYEWITSVPESDWLALIDIVTTANGATPGTNNDGVQAIALDGILDAIRTLSYRICAIGLEPRLVTAHDEIEKFESPFLVQNLEINAYLKSYACMLNGTLNEFDDAAHCLVMLDQCDNIIAKIRKNALQHGTSIALTYLLVALSQSIDRLRKLLYLVDTQWQLSRPISDSPHEETLSNSVEQVGTLRNAQRLAALYMGFELIEAHNKKYNLRDLFSNNIDLLARNVTENASRAGEHYIADNHTIYRAMFKSSAGAGLVIGFMALLKILASYLKAAPLIEAFLFSLNYSLGFMLIHVLHFTVATKQPAMTASRIAASVHSNVVKKNGRQIDMDSLVLLIVKVIRTQLIAVIGNLCTAIPTAFLIAFVWLMFTGHHLVSPEKALHMLHDIDPFSSFALFYAMIAGVCLFLAGLISGYYDNKALYACIAQRVSQLRGLGRLLGQERLHRFATYVENNLGGLMGNFYFGLLLGCIGTLGMLLGLPLDIRHVTFSGTNVAIAFVALDYQLTWQQLSMAAIGVALIGTTNLLVSFSLALWVALRSRQVRFQRGGELIAMLGLHFLRHPKDFFITPRAERREEKSAQ